MTTSSSPRSLTAIVLAAGKGTRMRSDLPKVLHKVAGRTMLGHVLAAVQAAGATRVGVVAEPGRADVAAEIERQAPGAGVFAQAERLGTAHAVLAARALLAEAADDVIVAFGDTPLVTAATFTRLRAPLAAGASVAVLAFETESPAGYGRVLTEGDRVLAIREKRMRPRPSGRCACAMPGSWPCRAPMPSPCWTGSATTTRRANITSPTPWLWPWRTGSRSRWCR